MRSVRRPYCSSAGVRVTETGWKFCCEFGSAPPGGTATDPALGIPGIGGGGSTCDRASRNTDRASS